MHIITRLVLNYFLYCSQQDTLEKENEFSVSFPQPSFSSNVLMAIQDSILLFLFLRYKENEASSVYGIYFSFFNVHIFLL